MAGDPYYTLARWQVREGENEAFVEAWRALGDAFAAVPGAPALTGTLLQSVDDPQTYVSFGPWPSLEHVQAMRADAGAKQAIERVMALCDEATPGAYRKVLEVQT